MSYPNIPDINPDISIGREQVKNILLASVALEELGLSHIINAEAEKIQYILGTLEGTIPPGTPTITELLTINRSVEHTLRSVIKTQMLLEFKLEDILEITNEEIIIHKNVATATGSFEGVQYLDTDVAYYYTESIQSNKQKEGIV